MLSDNVELLYFNICFKLILIVVVWFCNFGNILIVWVMLVGILIILLCILSCFFLGVCINFWNVIFGVSNLYFNVFRLKKFGFIGNVILLVIEYGGILFFIKYLEYVW